MRARWFVDGTTPDVVIAETFTDLTDDTLYRWRARVLRAEATGPLPANPASGPWRRLSAQGAEADIRVLPEPGALVSLLAGIALLGRLRQRRGSRRTTPAAARRRIAGALSVAALATGLCALCTEPAGASTPRDAELSIEFVLPGVAPLHMSQEMPVDVLISETSGALLQLRVGVAPVTGMAIGTATISPLSAVSVALRDAMTSAVVGGFHETSSGRLRLTQGAVPVPGELLFCLFSPSCFGPQTTVPLTGSSGVAGVGVGGVLTGTIQLGGTQYALSGAEWTLGSVAYATSFSFVSGFVHNPASSTVEDGLAALNDLTAGGVLQLVTPLSLTTSGGVLGSSEIDGFVRLTVHFVPEPAGFALLASGALGLMLLGRRRITTGGNR